MLCAAVSLSCSDTGPAPDAAAASARTPSLPPQPAPKPAAAAQPDAQAPPSPRELLLPPAGPADAPPAAAHDPGAAAGVQAAEVAPDARLANSAAAAAAPVPGGDAAAAASSPSDGWQLLQPGGAVKAAAQAECTRDAAAVPEEAVPGQTSDHDATVQGDGAIADAADVQDSQTANSRGVDGGQPPVAEAVDVPVAVALPPAGDTLLPSLQQRQQQLAPLRVPSKPAEQHLQVRGSSDDAARMQTMPRQQQQRQPPPLPQQQPVAAQLMLIPPEERQSTPTQAPQQRQQRQGGSRPAGGSSGNFTTTEIFKIGHRHAWQSVFACIAPQPSPSSTAKTGVVMQTNTFVLCL